MKHFLYLFTLYLSMTGYAIAGSNQAISNSETKATSAVLNTKYLISLQSNVAYCKSLINGIELFHNYNYDSGTISTGYNASAYLENGENDIEMYFISIDAPDTKKHRKNARCAITLTAASPSNEAKVTDIIATSDSNGYPTSIQSGKYEAQPKHFRVNELGFLSQKSPAYRMQRKVTCQGLPEWAWTKATPLQDTPETYRRLQDAYIKFGLIFAKSDFSAFKKAMELSIKERAAADDLDADFFLATTRMEQDFKQGITLVPIKDWSEYKLKLVTHVRRLNTLPVEEGNMLSFLFRSISLGLVSALIILVAFPQLRPNFVSEAASKQVSNIGSLQVW